MSSIILFFILMAAVYVQCAVPKGYLINHTANKAYKLMYQSKAWDKARASCIQEGAKLAVPKTPEEFKYLQRLVRGMKYPAIISDEAKIMVWLGISNLEDYNVWKNVDGENINETGFHEWAWGNGFYSTNPMEPHCVSMDAINTGLRDYWCDVMNPYICEKPIQ